jgi:hypothetical protein
MIRLNIAENKQVVVPLRFRRASDADAEREFPEIDDRGYLMGTRAGTWGQSKARGPMVGLTTGFTVTLRLEREDIDPGVPLFAKSTDTGVVKIIEPAGGGPIPASGDFKILGVADFANRPVSIQFRLGSLNGPVLAELEPHIFNSKKVKLVVHNVRVDDATGPGTRATLPFAQMAQRVRSIWWPAGLDMEHDPVARPDRNDNITLAVKDQVKLHGGGFGEVPAFLNRLSTLDDTVHVFLIDKFAPDPTDPPGTTVVGLGITPDLATQLACPPGIFISTNGVAGNNAAIELRSRTIAHEIGHFLTLEHVHRRNAGDPAGDTHSRRQLMYPLSNAKAEVLPRTLTSDHRFNDNGYGNRTRGWLLSLKNLDHHETDDEVAKARKRAQSVQGGRWS